MRNFILSLLLLMLTIGSPSASAMREIHWQKIMGWKHAEMQIYVDPATVMQKVSDDGVKYGYGAVLFHRQYPVTVTVGGESYVVTSLIQYYIVSCNQQAMAPIRDYYFNLDRLVVMADKPLLSIDNVGDKLKVKEISKNHPLYKTLCPEYI